MKHEDYDEIDVADVAEAEGQVETVHGSCRAARTGP